MLRVKMMIGLAHAVCVYVPTIHSNTSNLHIQKQLGARKVSSLHNIRSKIYTHIHILIHANVYGYIKIWHKKRYLSSIKLNAQHTNSYIYTHTSTYIIHAHMYTVYICVMYVHIYTYQLQCREVIEHERRKAARARSYIEDLDVRFGTPRILQWPVRVFMSWERWVTSEKSFSFCRARVHIWHVTLESRVKHLDI